jgi:hypothetical protein
MTTEHQSPHQSLRLSAALLVAGIVVSLLAGLLHPGRENPNDHRAVFAEYASSTDWTAVHLGQFAGMAILIAGLLVLFFALDPQAGMALWAGRLGAASAVVALALTAVLQAVDGVALKQAVDAWAVAPEAEKAARFASAETVRWLEWGMRSYQSFMLGLALLLFATAIVWTRRIPRPIGYLMGISGLAYLAQGWVLGAQGFAPAMTIPQLLGYLLIIAWSIWLLIVAFRKAPVGATRKQPPVL